MKIFDIVIDGKTYKYVDSIFLDNKSYIAYSDDKNIYVSSYIIVDDKVILDVIDEETLKKVKVVMNLE